MISSVKAKLFFVECMNVNARLTSILIIKKSRSWGGGGLGRYIFLPISFRRTDSYLKDWYILSPQSSLVVKGSLRNDDGDVNENGKNAIGYIGKTTLHAFFVHFFAVAARVWREYA